MLCLKLGTRIALTLAAPVAAIALGLAVTTTSFAEQVAVLAKPDSQPSGDINAVFKGQPCLASKTLAQFGAPITRVTRRLEAHQPVTIVAVGSSSTGGAGASSPAFSYPSRLEQELRQRFPGSPISVINRGVNGEEVANMMARMDAVLAPNPDLVIWQLGTNTILRDGNIPAAGDLLQSGIARIKDSGSDVLLVDPQFAPQVNAKPAAKDMVGLIAYVAKLTHVPLFARYAAMRHWHDDQAIGFDRFIAPDGLHMNDWGYSCFARLLADNIETAVARSHAVAVAKPGL